MTTRGQDGGKHRPGRSPWAWTPRTGRRRERAAHALTEAETEVIPIVDDYPDAPAAGLAKFNLGTIPASVTPPRTWRHAAWFAVTASALVLIGLVYAAATLVTGPRKPDVVDALPGLPTAPNLLALPTETATATSATRDPLPTSASPTTTVPTTTTSPTQRPEPSPSPAPERPPAASEPPAVPAPPSTRPPRTTVSTPVLVPVPTDPEAMGDETEAYFGQVVANPDAAYAMTTGPLRREGPDSIERRYAGVERIEVESITIDANDATTRSRLRVVREDGTATTVERELTFTYGSDPQISGDAAAS